MNSERAVLQDIRILDFSWVLAGPYATRLLADFGAEVIKVHPPAPDATDRFSRGYYNTWNRNKRSITLDMNQPAGRKIARRLVKICDIVVENFSPHVMRNWGMDYPRLKRLKPEIILLSLSAAGHSGPWSHYSGFGPTAQALAGLTCLTAYPGKPPSGIGYSYADHTAGLYGSLAGLAALEFRHQTGAGQFIDLSELETTTSLLADAIWDYTQNGRPPQPTGNDSNQWAPQGIYPCCGPDRWCAIAVTSAAEWDGFTRALGNPDWASAPRFATPDDRLANRQALDDLVSEWTRQLTAEEVIEQLQAAGVPAGVAQGAADLAGDPQLRSRGFFVELENPAPGTNLVDACPIKLSVSPARYRQGAPAPAGDNEYVYGQLLHMSQEDMAKLSADKVI